jgi:hypothetical protein
MFRALVMTALMSISSIGTGAEGRGADEQQAGERAKELLAETLKLAADKIEVKRIEPRTWNDSSLGCGKPGSLAMQVITEGFAVSLLAQGREHTVHVAGTNAVICDRPNLIRKDVRRSAHARGLDVMMEQARQDLATRLGVEPEKIRIAGMKPQQWQDSAMECSVSGEPIQPGPLRGYRLSLKYLSRVYTYHTDMKTVRACPAIEKE